MLRLTSDHFPVCELFPFSSLLYLSARPSLTLPYSLSSSCTIWGHWVSLRYPGLLVLYPGLSS